MKNETRLTPVVLRTYYITLSKLELQRYKKLNIEELLDVIDEKFKYGFDFRNTDWRYDCVDRTIYVLGQEEGNCLYAIKINNIAKFDK